MSQKSTNSADVSQSQRPDQAPLPPNQPVIQQSSGQAANEAIRSGLEDNSALIGAEVPTRDRMASGNSTTAGDPDAMGYQAKVVGEEAIGGTTSTPDQNNVDEIAVAVGLDPQPEQPMAVTDELYRRDDQWFELDPDSKDAIS
ncbi:MAG: DUF6335 family protein [Nodosilinea sp.]